jgi:hypothetical protein
LKELARLYIEADLANVSLCDHNTIAGVGIIRKSLSGSDTELFSGMEASCRDRIHVLGLGLNENSNILKNHCLHQELIHAERASAQIVVLEENNFIVDRSILKKERGVITEYEIFSATENNGGVFKDFAKKWLYKNSPYYVKIERMSVEEAINLIHDAGGIAIWAHPGFTFRKDLAMIIDKISEFKEFGLDGIEVFSSKHDNEQTRLLFKLAQKNKLAMSAGSDYHGSNERKLGGYNTFGLKFDEQKLIDLIRR